MAAKKIFKEISQIIVQSRITPSALDGIQDKVRAPDTRANEDLPSPSSRPPLPFPMPCPVPAAAAQPNICLLPSCDVSTSTFFPALTPQHQRPRPMISHLKDYGELQLHEWETVNVAVERRPSAPETGSWRGMTVEIKLRLNADAEPETVEQWYFGLSGQPKLSRKEVNAMYKALYTHLRVLPLFWLKSKSLPPLEFSYEVFSGPPQRPLSASPSEVHIGPILHFDQQYDARAPFFGGHAHTVAP